MSKEYDAYLGAVMLYSTPNLTPALTRSKLVLIDNFGGKLKIGPPSRKAIRIAAQHAKSPFEVWREDVNFVLHYEVKTKWSGAAYWQPHVERVRDFCTYAFLLTGPFILKDQTIGYVEVAGQPGTRTEDIKGRTFPPQCAPWYMIGIQTVPREFDSFVSVCRQLHAALGNQLFLHPGTRWQSPRREEHQGTRLELALVLLGHATTYSHLYDMPLRLSVALEALFQCVQIDARSLRLICARLLKNTHKPREVLELLLAISDWRNRFVHGQEPPFRYPPGSEHTKLLVQAAASGFRLLSALILTILKDKKLVSIFNTVADDKRFAEALFDTCAA